MTSTSTQDSDRTNTDALREVWTMAHDLVTSGDACGGLSGRLAVRHILTL